MSTIYLNKSNATIDVGSDASYVITGDDDTISVGDDSAVMAEGSALLAKVIGLGDFITIGGDGEWAPDGSDDVVQFQASGTLDVLATSRVDALGSDVTATLAGDDTFGIYGSDDSVAAGGTSNGIWIGQNGESASAAEIDAVHGLTGGTLFELGDSHVNVDGADFTATVSGQDILRATGDHLVVNATGAGNVINIGGNKAGDDDLVNLASGGIVNEFDDSSLVVTGDDTAVRLAGADFLKLSGASDRVVLTGQSNRVEIGQSGGSTGVDAVVYPYDFFDTPISVLPNSNVRLVGSNGDIVLQGDDRVVVAGQLNQGNLISDTAGGNHIIVGGFAQPAPTTFENQATLTPGDWVTERSNSNLALTTAGPASDGEFRVVMGADDQLDISQGFTIVVPVAAGADSIATFGATDVLKLDAQFSGIQALLGATTQVGGASVIALDASGDTLTLPGVDKATFTSYAEAGLVRFA